MGKTSSFDYQLFVSYTRTPDGPLAREIERFLEAFHDSMRPPATTDPLSPLHICIDGSDFRMPPLEGEGLATGRERDVLSVVFAHLERARELLVLCSEASARSRWVEEEVRRFIELRGVGAVRLGYTEGTNPWDEPERYLAPTLRRHDLHKNIAYDLRGYDARRARALEQVPEFEREIVMLAAHLHGRAPGELYPSWLEAELQRARTQSLTMASGARFETLIGDPAHALLQAYRAHELHPSPETETALRDAYKVALFHHYNRRETAQFSGAGPGYLAGRWKQGEVFVKTSPDGRHRLLVTERGKDGPNPPGEVYLVSNETQRVVKLEPTAGGRGRVEEVAFDTASRHVFVVRYFQLAIYSLDGRCVGEYAFSRHTKSPVHNVAGYLHGRYVLGGETKGGLWLVDPHGDRASTIQVLRERHGDATTQIAIAGAGSAAMVVFESGRAALLTLRDGRGAVLTDVVPGGALFAAFMRGDDSHVLTGDGDGVVQLWRRAGERINQAAASERLGAPIDWITVAEDGEQLAAVSADQRVFILDKALERLATLDYRDDIDWGAVRAVRIPDREVRPAPAAEPCQELPYPSDALQPVATFALDDTWIITEQRDEKKEYALPDPQAWRIEGDVARRYASHVATIRQHGDIVWLHGQLSLRGPAFWRTDSSLRRFPSKDVDANAILERDGVIWVGTDRGAYRHQGGDHRLVSPEDVRIEMIKEVGGRLWLAGPDGAYVVEDERTVRITEPFVKVSDIVEAAGSAWILTRRETGGWFDSAGPAYLADDYFARPVPAGRTEVASVLEAGGWAWLIEKKRIHKWDGRQITTFERFGACVNALVVTGDVAWATTASRGLDFGPNSAYRIDLKTQQVRDLELSMPTLVVQGKQPLLKYYKSGENIVAKISAKRLKIVERTPVAVEAAPDLDLR